MTTTWATLIQDAFIEIGVWGPADTIPTTDQAYAARKLGRLVDEWAGLRQYAYTTTFTPYTLTPNHQPHTIGPSVADFTQTQRPVRVHSANLVLSDQTPSVDNWLTKRDRDWWAAQRVKTLTSTIPTDFYYEPDSPNGSLYLWPVPTAAYGLILETETVISAVPTDLTLSLTAPNIYTKAVVLTLAEELCGPYGKQPPGELAIKAARARAELVSNNLQSPRVASADIGMSTSLIRRGWNWLTGQPS